MKTFNIIAMVVFTITTIACVVGALYNKAHFLYATISFTMALIALCDYKNQKS